MNTKDINLKILIQNYSSLEKVIQKRIKQISEHFCRECPSKCCKEEMCRESIESRFLYLVNKKQNDDYDFLNGWIGSSGCKLVYGRPLVCYEFFCEKILSDNNFRASNIQQIIREFISIGARAYGNTHLICVDDLKKMSKEKIVKINTKIEGLISKLADEHMRMGLESK